MREQLALLPEYATRHMQLALMALLVGIMVSVPLGVLVARVRWLEQPILGVASVIQTVPSLALLALMVPILAALDFASIGYLPAFVGLVLYSMLPILRNTVTGLATVDPALIEAARGVGMTDRQQLLRVSLPMAMPVIIAGIRTSTVWTVGMATLSTPVGATSLGNYIFSGLQTRNLNAIAVGCAAAAALALLFDGIVRAVAVGWERQRPWLLRGALSVVALLYLYTAVSIASGLGSSERRILVGAKTFTEQYILSEIIALEIESETGLECEAVQSLGSMVAFDALAAGEIDAYVDYSGTIWATVMKRDATPSDRARMLPEIEAYLRQHHDIVLVGALGFENAYALAMHRPRAEQLGIRRISDLTLHSSKLSMGGDYEFFGRPEWRRIRDLYALESENLRSMDPALMYQAVARGDVDVISAFSSDGRIAAFDLIVLEDDRGAIPPYDAIVLASARLERDQPEAMRALRVLLGTIDDDAMRRMNQQVDSDGESPSAVARRFLSTFNAGRKTRASPPP